MAALVTNYSQACKILGVVRAAEGGYTCSAGKCGTVPRDGGEKWFHSEKCKEIFEKVIRNRKLINEAYTFLTGNAGKGNQNPGGGGGQTPDQPELEVCDRCGEKYDFSQKFPKFKKKEEENENYWFCSKKCYDCFNVCDNCGKIERLKENELRQGI
ncbi:11144_t:CDS:2 [Cetraspora pellucida]|uniref:11144_t:CDS:1 n=1 Tax=Cetraspora pellucida TaxID=1433469 RepID=A0ACA9NQA0_9GLOM|nr:11144_t:CDS:2 [Cetraspora pellucida]